MLSLWLVQLEHLNPILAAACVALGTFVVALPRFIPLLSKRIALCGLVLVYVGAVIAGPESSIVMRPVYVAASTALGAVASILAMSVPIPHLATLEVKKKCKSYVENATKRMNLYMKAMVTEQSSEALELASEAKTLGESAAKLMKNIQKCQDGMLWEVPHVRLSAARYKQPADSLKEVEVTLRGMEMAIAASRSQTLANSINQQVKDEMKAVAQQLTQKFTQIKTSLPFSTPTTPYQNPKNDAEKLLPLDIMQHLPLSFFLFCTKYLKRDFAAFNSQKSFRMDDEKRSWGKMLKRWLPRRQDIMLATKWSLSLGLAVLLGLTYNKNQGYWSGLAISISFATKRQATFSGANARAQGTALGSIYGILGYFVCHKFASLRLAFLLPWIVFTTFLRHSKSYGEAGGISAIIAAFVILGRVGYGTPAAFGIERMTEACIGLFCYILVEVLLQPRRAATLSKSQVSHCIGATKHFMEQFVAIKTSGLTESHPLLEHEKRKMRSKTVALQEFIREAKLEPNFWFKPFQGDNYTMLLSSISRMVDLLSFAASATELFSEELEKAGVTWKDSKEQISIDIELFKTNICSSLKYLEEETSTKPMPADPKKQEASTSSDDVETGSSQNSKRFCITSADEVELENIIGTFLLHSRELIESSRVAETAEGRNKVLLCLGCIGFCMQSLVTETREVGKVVKELSRRENS